MKLYDVESGREQWYDPHTVDKHSWDEEEEFPEICTVDQLHDCLKYLTARQRFVLELRFGLRDGETHTQEEVAKTCGWHLSTVQEHEHFGMQRIYKIMTGEVRKNTP